jgi:hypothetical protein
LARLLHFCESIMSSFGDIIPIASRRRTPPAPQAAPASVRRRASGALAPLIIFVTIFGGGTLGLLYESHAHGVVAHLSAEERGAIFKRAHEDLEQTCTLPAAAEGPLHDHCVETAAFVLLFPECRGACVDLARAIQPHAHR